MPQGTLTILETYQSLECIECGTMFAMTASFVRERRGDHKTFYCPRGHKQYYPGTSDAEKARADAERAEAAAERLRLQLRRREEDIQAERRRHAATKGQLTKTKRRIAHGVCPCCGRSFQQLSRHMSNKHPEYVEDAKA